MGFRLPEPRIGPVSLRRRDERSAPHSADLPATMGPEPRPVPESRSGLAHVPARGAFSPPRRLVTPLRRVPPGAGVVTPYIAHQGDPYVSPAGVAKQGHPEEGGPRVAVPGQRFWPHQAQACLDQVPAARTP